MTKDYSKMTNKELLINLVVKTAVMEERLDTSYSKVEECNKYIKELNAKAIVATDLSAKSMAKSEYALEHSIKTRSHLDKLQVAVITASIAAITSLVVALVQLVMRINWG